LLTIMIAINNGNLKNVEKGLSCEQCKKIFCEESKQLDICHKCNKIMACEDCKAFSRCDEVRWPSLITFAHLASLFILTLLQSYLFLSLLLLLEYISYSTSCETVIPNPISPPIQSPTIFHSS
jgi:hypothetical protein